MAFFRKRCSLGEAHELLHTIVVPPISQDQGPFDDVANLASADRVRREFIALRLFGVLAALKASRHEDWKIQGRDQFDHLFETTLQSYMKEQSESELLARSWLGERTQYYSLLQHMAASIDEVGTEVGNSFAMLFAQPPSDLLSRLGRGTFLRAFEQALARQDDFKLVQAAPSHD